MHLLRALIDVSLGIEVLVIGSAGESSIEELHAAYLDDSVLLFDFEPRGFRIQHDLAHQGLPRRQQAVDGDVGQLIHVFIAFMSRMSFDPMPLDVLSRDGGVQQLP
jgi:hypothetical protein